MLEHHPRRQQQPRPPRPAHQLDRHDAVAAKLEEVVVDADPLNPQNLGKQPAQQRLRGRPRRPVRPQRHNAPAQAAHAGRACRSASAAAHPAPRSQTAPCSPAAPAASAARSPATSSAAPDSRQPHSRPAAAPPEPSPRHTTAAGDTPGCETSAASISPGSIRNPRSFTCASARPRNSSTPSDRHRARSPVRYIRPPAAAMRVRNKPLRRQPSPLQIAPRKPHPAMYKLANNPTGTGSRPPSRTYARVVRQSDDRSERADLTSSHDLADDRASTVVSVGPYALIISADSQRPPMTFATRPTTLRLQRPSSNCKSCDALCNDASRAMSRAVQTTATANEDQLDVVLRYRARSPRRSTIRRAATSVPPLRRTRNAAQNCRNAIDEDAEPRSAIANRSTMRRSIRFAMLACSTTTPFGVPVEPEV